MNLFPHHRPRGQAVFRLFWVAAFVCAFPLSARADGIYVHELTLSPSTIVLLAKILMISADKRSAKIRVIKKYRRPPPANTSALADEKPGDEIEIRLHQERLSEPNKWVEELTYWNSTKNFAAGDTMFFVGGGDEFEASPHTQNDEKKFDLYFDEQKYKETLTQLSNERLRDMMADRDFESDVVDELVRRKALTGDHLWAQRNPDTFYRIFRRYVGGLPPADQKTVLMGLAAGAHRQNKERQTAFIGALRGLNINDPEVVLPVLNVLDTTADPVQQLFRETAYTLRKEFDAGQFQGLAAAKPLFLAAARLGQLGSLEIKAEDFYNHLPPSELTDFLVAIAEQYGKTPREWKLDGISKEVLRTKNVPAAWALTRLNLDELHERKREALFNDVLSVLFEKEDLTNPAKKEALLNFARPRLAFTHYPWPLSLENKAAYLQWGGHIYEELTMLRAEEVSAPTPWDSFLRYHDIALLIDLKEVGADEKFPTARYTVKKVWRALNPTTNNSSYDNITTLCHQAKEGASFFVRLESETVPLLKKRVGATFFLVASLNSHHFKLYDESFRDKIEAAFLNQKLKP